MKELKEPLLNYWYRALHSPFGVELVVSDFEPARQKLYAVRREARDLDLEQIALCANPFDPQRLWLVRKTHPNASDAS